ncbi:pentatricopeptide repeat-containing protein At4g21170-like [Silene latifolia]|uniref:pentatricopeptide repeat-containing protein At4g21170-like n=1 Tax=Silene latifolia TaxID=37657 RepID=UPI003D78652E
MSLQRKLLNHKFIKHFSTSSSNPTLKSSSTSTSSSSSTSITWRNEAKQHQLISQITLILLQRNNWSSLLKTLNLSSKLTPDIFHQIIHKTQQNPQISLSFFNWVTSNFVNFQPFLKTQCKIIQISLGSAGAGGSGLTRPVKEVLDSVIEVNPLNNVVCSMSYACKGTNLHSLAFSCIIESYALKGLYVNGLEIYREIVLFGCLPKVGCLNVLLDVLDNAREFKLSYCLLGSMFRNRILMDDDTWGVIGRILCKDGKFECVVRLLKSGVCNSSIFELVIDGYSKNGNFEGAFGYLNEMCRRGFEPGFCSYGCILNGACEFGDSRVRDTVLFGMMEKGLVPVDMVLGYDDAIVKLCDLEKIYAAEYMFKRAQGEGEYKFIRVRFILRLNFM